MSVIGIGTDLVAVRRIAKILERHPERFGERCFLPGEVLPARKKNGNAGGFDPVSVAGRWAAKEAFLKALGTDVSNLPYRDIEVVGSPTGPVRLVLHGRALAALGLVGGKRIHLAISHEFHYAVSFVLIEG